MSGAKRLIFSQKPGCARESWKIVLTAALGKTFVNRDAFELEVPGLRIGGSRNSEDKDEVYEILKTHDYFTTILPFPRLVILPISAESLTPLS